MTFEGKGGMHSHSLDQKNPGIPATYLPTGGSASRSRPIPAPKRYSFERETSFLWYGFSSTNPQQCLPMLCFQVHPEPARVKCFASCHVLGRFSSVLSLETGDGPNDAFT